MRGGRQQEWFFLECDSFWKDATSTKQEYKRVKLMNNKMFKGKVSSRHFGTNFLFSWEKNEALSLKHCKKSD